MNRREKKPVRDSCCLSVIKVTVRFMLSKTLAVRKPYMRTREDPDTGE